MFRPNILLFLLMSAACCLAQNSSKDLYTKYEYMIPMRDGVKLYTSVYVPKGANGSSPIMLERTPYSAGPYGADAYRSSFRGSKKFKDSQYIYAYQDVRGKYFSEGEFENLRPQLLPVFGQDGWSNGAHDIDESTDTYDSIDYLVKNVPGNNGRVGMWGISYPGGYAALGAMSRHPALKAVSPQAPTSDWFLGDDMHHNGAFFLQDFVSFFSGFGVVRPGPGARGGERAAFDMKGDSYKFFLELGGLSNVEPQIFKGRVPYWNDIVRHDTYDEFWQARSVPSGLVNLKCAILWTGGFFDAEDCWGPLWCYKSAESKNPGLKNYLVMGPWYHGMWASANGQKFHDQDWGFNTSEWYQEEVEFPFFDTHLRGNGEFEPAEATVFDSGAKKFQRFDSWPPKNSKPVTLHLGTNGQLSFAKGAAGSVSYVSDPSNPVPYEGGKLVGRSRSYMLADQRFTAERSDVLKFTSATLTEDITLVGELKPELFVKVDGTDADFVVKLVDVFPADSELPDYQMLVRGEVMRSKFRDSFSNPRPLVANQIEKVGFTAPDTFHTFKKGHKIMVQVQSSWFPLVDRNPHKFMNIFTATNADFKPAKIELQLGGANGSQIQLRRLGD